MLHEDSVLKAEGGGGGGGPPCEARELSAATTSSNWKSASIHTVQQWIVGKPVMNIFGVHVSAFYRSFVPRPDDVSIIA